VTFLREGVSETAANTEDMRGSVGPKSIRKPTTAIDLSVSESMTYARSQGSKYEELHHTCRFEHKVYLHRVVFVIDTVLTWRMEMKLYKGECLVRIDQSSIDDDFNIGTQIIKICPSRI
jgi:hypothetical protein